MYGMTSCHVDLARAPSRAEDRSEICTCIQEGKDHRAKIVQRPTLYGALVVPGIVTFVGRVYSPSGQRSAELFTLQTVGVEIAPVKFFDTSISVEASIAIREGPTTIWTKLTFRAAQATITST